MLQVIAKNKFPRVNFARPKQWLLKWTLSDIFLADKLLSLLQEFGPSAPLNFAKERHLSDEGPRGVQPVEGFLLREDPQGEPQELRSYGGNPSEDSLPEDSPIQRNVSDPSRLGGSGAVASGEGANSLADTSERVDIAQHEPARKRRKGSNPMRAGQPSTGDITAPRMMNGKAGGGGSEHTSSNFAVSAAGNNPETLPENHENTLELIAECRNILNGLYKNKVAPCLEQPENLDSGLRDARIIGVNCLKKSNSKLFLKALRWILAVRGGKTCCARFVEFLWDRLIDFMEENGIVWQRPDRWI